MLSIQNFQGIGTVAIFINTLNQIYTKLQKHLLLLFTVFKLKLTFSQV
jgi:hypothetical protein